MASPISPSVGLGSGLDITSIVTALVNADKTAAQTQITNSQATNTMQLSGVGSLKSALTTFQTALTNLGSTTTPQFAGFSATSGTPSTLTATTDNTAVAGSYNITVNALATSSQIASASFSGGASSAIPSGTLTISQNGTNYNVTIPANATLQSTRDAINSSLSGNGISANIVTDSSGASRLVFGSTTTGAGSDLSVSGIAGLQIDGTQVMSNPPTATSSGAITATAQNASLTVNGLTVTSKSNTVSGAVSGMTLNLLSAGTGTPPSGASSTVTVGTNSSRSADLDPDVRERLQQPDDHHRHPHVPRRPMPMVMSCRRRSLRLHASLADFQYPWCAHHAWVGWSVGGAVATGCGDRSGYG